MDADFIIGIVMVALWLLSSLAARVGKAMKRLSPPQEAPSDGGAAENPFQRALRELTEQLDVQPEAIPEAIPAEPPVASEHRRTASEHDHTPGWHDRTASEHDHTPGWHDRTASEVRRTASEVRRTASEVRLAASEHLPGDVQGLRIPQVQPIRRRWRSQLARQLHADLTGGPRSLARGVLLSEILGPPVSLRPGDGERR